MITLIKYECRKIFSKKVIYIALLLFLILNFINIYNTFQVYDYNLYTIPKEFQKQVTKDMVNDASDARKNYQGFSYHESTDKAKKEINTYHAILNANHLDELHIKTIKELMTKLGSYNSEYKSSYDYRNTALHYKMLNKLTTPFVHNEAGWREIIHYINSYGMIYVSIMIILGVSTSITSEYTTNMDSLLKSCKKGKKQLITAKIYATLLYTTSIAVFFTLFNTLPYLSVLNRYGWKVPIQNINMFNLSPYNLTVGNYFILHFFVHLLGAIIFAMIVLLVSSLSRSIITSLFISGSIWALPLAIEQYTYLSEKPPILYYSLTQIIKAEPLFRQYKTMNIFGYPVLYPYFILTLYILLLPIIIRFIYYTFKTKHVH